MSGLHAVLRGHVNYGDLAPTSSSESEKPIFEGEKLITKCWEKQVATAHAIIRECHTSKRPMLWQEEKESVHSSAVIGMLFKD